MKNLMIHLVQEVLVMLLPVDFLMRKILKIKNKKIRKKNKKNKIMIEEQLIILDEIVKFMIQ